MDIARVEHGCIESSGWERGGAAPYLEFWNDLFLWQFFGDLGYFLGNKIFLGQKQLSVQKKRMPMGLCDVSKNGWTRVGEGRVLGTGEKAHIFPYIGKWIEMCNTHSGR